MFLMVEGLGTLDADLPSLKHHIRICFAYATLVISNAGTWAVWSLYAHNDIPFKSCYPWTNDGFGFLLSNYEYTLSSLI